MRPQIRRAVASAVRGAAVRLGKAVDDATVIELHQNLNTFRVELTVRLNEIFTRKVVTE